MPKPITVTLDRKALAAIRNPVTRTEFAKLQKYTRDAMRLASTHDPDHAKQFKYIDKILADHHAWLLGINSRLDIIERQLQRLGAPQYRVVKKGKKNA